MNDQEKMKFKENINKFSIKHLIGWQCAISFIMMLPEVSMNLNVKLHDMFDIIDSEFMKKIEGEREDL